MEVSLAHTLQACQLDSDVEMSFQVMEPMSIVRIYHMWSIIDLLSENTNPKTWRGWNLKPKFQVNLIRKK